MAPTQARARRQGVSKTVSRKPRPTKQTSDSWELLERQRSDSRDSDIENEDPADDTLAQPKDSIQALQEMADRLGREVETFAESLDKFLDDIRPDEAYDAAHDLVLEFKDIALDKVKELTNKYHREHTNELQREWAQQAKISTSSLKSVLALSSQSQSITYTRVKELRRYQEEADTWELFRIILEQHYRPKSAAYNAEKDEKLRKLGHVNHYTSESALHDRFMVEDSLGQERALVKLWLEQTASHQQSDIPEIMQALEKKTNIGAGLWTRGCLNTREKIKGEKRLRSWPAPDSSPLPQLRSVDTNELIITSLDPDASNRQGRSIEKEDEYFERAIWITCWELLRRGSSWSDVCDWCESQNEGWRAVAMGKGMTISDVSSLSIWRKMCFMASQGPCSNEYEAAVFGLLGGNVAAMQPVCRTVDDQLFAHYSASLVQQFDQYVANNYPKHTLPRSASLNSDLRSPDSAQSAIQELITKLRARPETRSQSTSPLKVVQSYLLANQTESLVHTLGIAIAGAEQLDETSLTVIARPRETDDTGSARPEADAAQDPTSLRVVAHICIILQVLRREKLVFEEQEMEDNVLVAYIQELHTAGKRDITPLYASRLQRTRYVAAMASVLPSITSSKEKQDLVALMMQKGMDVPAILSKQLNQMLRLATLDVSDSRSFRILENVKDEIWPGQRIDLKACPDVATPSQEALVRSLEWYLLLPGNWDATFNALTLALRTVLLSNCFACARLIVESFKSHVVAETKSYQILGRTVHLFGEHGSRPGDQEEAAQWKSMQRRAKSYVELERLVDVFEALFAWRKQEDLYLHTRHASSSLPQGLKLAFDAVREAIEPLLDVDGFLLDSFTEDEDKDFERIRENYVTEAILAYNTVLHAAGSMISRDTLLISMDLATVVATETTGLTETFTDAKRLKELVTSFAHTSKRILVMKNTGKPWKPKHERREGKDAGIWNINTRPIDGAERAAANV